MIVIPTQLNKPAIAQISYSYLKSLGLTAGDWVKINNKLSNLFYYGCIWPTNIPDDHIIVDDFIQFDFGSEKDDEPTIVPIDRIRIAIEAKVSVTVLEPNDTEAQKRDIGFIYDEGSDIQKLEAIRNFVDGMLVHPSAILSRSSSSVLSIKVISTYPKNISVILSSATKLSIIPPTTETEQLENLTSSIANLSLANNNRLISTDRPKGLEKAYDRLLEIVSYPLIYKDWIEQMGIECPKGILLYGPPGVGKTYLVSSVARACHAEIFTLSGSEIYGAYMGESEEKLRAKFKQAQEAAVKKDTPVLLFMDEIDALTPHRDRAQSHENRVVAQLLTLMDGMESRGRLVIVGATNRPNAIDPALRRPGRFDREISIDAPDVETRKTLFASQLSNMPLEDGINSELLASTTNGFVAADITALCREAAMHAVERASHTSTFDLKVDLNDFKMALSIVRPSMQRGFQVEVEKSSWQDVGGLQEVKKQLKQAVEWPIIHKDSFIRLGLKPPRGILLYGPPGCSKTTLVKVIASSSGTAFLSINGAQLYSPYVGDSEKVVRTTFQKARASAPAIIFLDETEAIVGKRNMGSGGSNSGDSVQERVLSTLLNEMDGVETAESVLVVGATNRPDMLDAALLRPGRFDRLVYVPPPDEEARNEILKIHTRKTPLSDNVDLISIAKQTNMYTGADLQNICREAAMMALRDMHTADKVEMIHFEKALKMVPPTITLSMLETYENSNKKALAG